MVHRIDGKSTASQSSNHRHIFGCTASEEHHVVQKNVPKPKARKKDFLNIFLGTGRYLHQVILHRELPAKLLDNFLRSNAMMMIAFITIKSSLVPLIEGLCAQI